MNQTEIKPDGWQDPLDAASWADMTDVTLDRQNELVSELDEMATRQQQLIREGTADELLALLASRQQILDEFVLLQERIGRLSNLAEQWNDAIAEEVRSGVRARLNDLGTRLDRIMARDRSDEAELRERQSRAGAELKNINTTQAAHRAYAGPERRTNQYADRKG